MKVTGIDHVGLDVESLDDAKKLLCDMFGLSISHEMNQPAARAAFVRAGSSLVELIEWKNKPPPDHPARLDHFAVVVERLDEVLDQLKRLGVRFDRPEPTLRERPDGRVRIITTAPETTFGLCVQLVERLS